MNTLYFGDNLNVLKRLSQEHPHGCIDLIYIDPPFNSKRNYNILFEDADLEDTKAQKEAFADTWSTISYLDTLEEIKTLDLGLYYVLHAFDQASVSKSALSYLATMAIRIWYMHKVLKDTGSFYLHCDSTMSHYLKIICDLIFKEKNFRNEICWCYRGGGSSKRDFGQRHDIILRYSKTDNYCFLPDNIRVPYQAEGIKRTDDAMWGKHKGTNKVYKPHPLGKVPEDWWIINILNANDPERLGYPTQKPEALLERIIKASSNEGDLVADFFCGCGTTIAVAQKLNRQWFGVDISHLAVRLVIKRLQDTYDTKYAEIRNTFEIQGIPKDIASAKELAETPQKGRFKFQDWVIEFLLGGVSNPKKTADGGWDGHITFAMGKKKEIILIEVKSGKVNVKNLREFMHVVTAQQATIGVFVCFQEYVTQPMEREAKQAGYYSPHITNHDVGVYTTQFPKIQILTIEQILHGEQVKMPITTQGIFKTAGKHIQSGTQEPLIYTDKDT